MFASLSAAYQLLSTRMQRYLDGLTATHSGEHSFGHLFKFDPGQASSHTWPMNRHPVVRRHPLTGQPGLFSDREFTQSIDDLPKEEGRALLDFLFDHCERVDFQCRFKWTKNAIAIWDNRVVLHHAIWDYWPQTRRGRRISVVGEKPVAYRLAEEKNLSAENERGETETSQALRITI